MARLVGVAGVAVVRWVSWGGRGSSGKVGSMGWKWLGVAGMALVARGINRVMV